MHYSRKTALGAVPAWWRTGRRAANAHRVCFPTKEQALMALYDENVDLIEEKFGGLDNQDSSGTFDAINEYYALRGKQRVKTIGEALWHAVGRRPYCLDHLDLSRLNDLPPAQEGGGFRLPGPTLEALQAKRDRWCQDRGFHGTSLGRAVCHRGRRRRRSQ